MLLLIDAGNTNIVFALHDGTDFCHVWRCETIDGRAADEYAAWLGPLCAQAGIDFADITSAIFCSVVPAVNDPVRMFCERYIGRAPLYVDYKAIDMAIKLDKPSEIGADRLVNALAVKTYYRYPAVVLDFGTATTFDVIDGQGAYGGGVIAPGVNLSMQALQQAAAKLPQIDIARPEKVIGIDTVSAMQSGIYWGYVGMIEGTMKRIEQEMAAAPYIIATGGLAGLFADSIPAIRKVDKNLTLRGLLQIYLGRQSF